MYENGTGGVLPLSHSIHNDEVPKPMVGEGQGSSQTRRTGSNDQRASARWERHVWDPEFPAAKEGWRGQNQTLGYISHCVIPVLDLNISKSSEPAECTIETRRVHRH